MQHPRRQASYKLGERFLCTKAHVQGLPKQPLCWTLNHGLQGFPTVGTRGPSWAGTKISRAFILHLSDFQHGHRSRNLGYLPLRPFMGHPIPGPFTFLSRRCGQGSYYDLLKHARVAHSDPISHPVFPSCTLPICLHESLAAG